MDLRFCLTMDNSIAILIFINHSLQEQSKNRRPIGQNKKLTTLSLNHNINQNSKITKTFFIHWDLGSAHPHLQLGNPPIAIPVKNLATTFQIPTRTYDQNRKKREKKKEQDWKGCSKTFLSKLEDIKVTQRLPDWIQNCCCRLTKSKILRSKALWVKIVLRIVQIL